MFKRKQARGLTNSDQVIEKARRVKEAFEGGVPLDEALRQQGLREDQYLDALAKTVGSGKLTAFRR